MYKVEAPTKLVAIDIGGCTLHSGLFNRRNNDAGSRCSRHMRLMLVDEFSMVGLGRNKRIDTGLHEAVGVADQVFGGVLAVWIGDVHQLPPVLENQ